jgi:copper chaperone CopZ
MATVSEIRVSGMHCDGCVRRLKNALAGITDIKVLSVDVGLVEVELASAEARAKVEQAITSAGYSVG